MWWLHLRDCNTKFFHVRALQRRKSNHIFAIHNYSKAIELKATNFYQNLYGQDLGPIRNLSLHRFLKLETPDLKFLGRVIMDKEIKAALFDMALLKALGSDGFHAVFFFRNCGVLLGLLSMIRLRKFLMEAQLTTILITLWSSLSLRSKTLRNFPNFNRLSFVLSFTSS